MILDKEILVPLGSKNITYFKKLGYNLPTEKDSRGRIRVKKKEGLLVKISDLPISSSVKIKVKCEDCNKEREVEYGSLANRVNSSYTKNEETLCSLCANRRMSGENSGTYKHGNILFPQYRNNANSRGIKFNLTIEEFKKLVPSNCFYCGDKSKGIDRWDSTKEYSEQNCVPCCESCNFMKNSTPPEVFLEKIKKIFENIWKNTI